MGQIRAGGRSGRDDAPRPRLSGHQSFPLRYGWLKKAYDAVEAADRAGEPSVFAAEDAIARFGVGKNMVASIRHWATVCRIVTGDGRKPTRLGRFLFADDGGLDPYMEDPVSAWLLHWALTSSQRLTTWFWAFNRYPALGFDRPALVRGISNYVANEPRVRASPATIRRDVACFVLNYAGRRPTKRTTPEDALESPLTELGLIRRGDRADRFRFVRGRKPTLGAGMVAFAVHAFRARRRSASTLSFEALAHEPGSPGRIFLLDEDALADLLEDIRDVTNGAYEWSETAGLKQLIQRRPGLELADALPWVAGDAAKTLARHAA